MHIRQKRPVYGKIDPFMRMQQKRPMDMKSVLQSMSERASERASESRSLYTNWR